MAEHNLKILIVDDDPNDLDGLKQALSLLRVELSTLQDPLQVVDQVKSQRPDLLLLDALLPGLSGFDLSKQVKTSAEGKATSVLILTGVYLKDHYRREALSQFKADGFLTKPYRPRELQRLVVKLLAKKLKTTPKKLEERIGPSREELLPSERETKSGWLGRLFGKRRSEPTASGFLHTAPPSPMARTATKEPVPATATVNEVAPLETETTIPEPEGDKTTIPEPEPPEALDGEELPEVEAEEAQMEEDRQAEPEPEPEPKPEEAELEPRLRVSLEEEPLEEGPEPAESHALTPPEETSIDEEPPEGEKEQPLTERAELLSPEERSFDDELPEGEIEEQPQLPALEPTTEDVPEQAAPSAEALSATEPTEPREMEPATEGVGLKPSEGPVLDDELPEQAEQAEQAEEEKYLPLSSEPEADASQSDAYILHPPEESELDIRAAKTIFKDIANALEDTQETLKKSTREGLAAERKAGADESAGVVVEEGETAVEQSDEEDALSTVKTLAFDRAELLREPTPAGEVAAEPSAGRKPFAELPIYEEEDFLFELKRQLKMCKRVGRSFTLILVRIADLGQIAELFGKDARAKVFLHVAQQSVASLREIDMVGLLRKQELIALAAFASERYGGGQIISRLKMTLKRNPFSVGENIPPFVPKLHFGMATYPSEVEGFEELLERAQSELAR